MTSAHACAQPGDSRRIAAIFADHQGAYRAAYPPSSGQKRVISAIAACRTAALGGHLQICRDCDKSIPMYNSCRNRHCPTCQGAQQARWLAMREQTILPIPYYHVVFTLPASLRELVRRNPRTLLGLLMRCAADTLLTLGGDPKRLGARLGVTTVLHTWTRTLQYHPHVHCIVTGGGLSVDGHRWIRARQSFLFAAGVVRRLFRGRFMAALRQLYAQGRLALDGPLACLHDPGQFRIFKEALYDQNWVVYAKAPFGGARQVFAYLGRYTHRVGLTNARIKSVTSDAVTFATKMARTTTIAPVEFMRRFLLHVLPKGFVKIRHYGIYAAKQVRHVLPKARALIESMDVRGARRPHGVTQQMARATSQNQGIIAGPWQARLKLLTGIDVTRCRHCGSHRLHQHPLPRRDSS